jgi:hypothetical protein
LINKIEIQPYQVAKKYRCNLCDRLEKVEKRLVVWRKNQVVGDLLLCNPCLETIVEIIRGKEEIIEEWNFRGGE